MHSIGIVGAGRIAHVHARNLHLLTETRLAGVVDIDPDQAARFAAQYGAAVYSSLEALLKDPAVDGVIICTPTAAHRDQALRTLQAGKHLLCEKPLAMNLEQADEILAAAATSPGILMAGHIIRFMADYGQVHRLLQEGAVGAIRTLHSGRRSGAAGHSWQAWLQGNEQGLGAFEAQIHDLDFLLWVLGEPCRVTSRGWRSPAGGWAHVTTVLDYADGRFATAEGSLALPGSYPFTMAARAIGAGGALEYRYAGASYAEPAERSLILYSQGQTPQDQTPPPGDAYRAELAAFVSAMENGIVPAGADGPHARAVLALVLAARRSLEEEGRPITLETHG